MWKRTTLRSSLFFALHFHEPDYVINCHQTPKIGVKEKNVQYWHPCRVFVFFGKMFSIILSALRPWMQC